MSDRTVLDLVEHVYAAGCDPSEWSTLVAKVQAAIPCAAVSSLLNIQGTEIAYHSAVVGLPEDFVESYVSHYHRINPYNRIFAAVPTGKVYCSGELGPPGWLDRQDFFHEWLKPAGNYTRGAGAVLARDQARQLRVSIDLPGQYGHMEAASAALLERIGPHMIRAFELNERLGAAATTSQALGGLLDRIEGAAAILDARGRVLNMNRAAEAIVRQRSLATVGPDRRLSFRQPTHDAAYRRALAVALDAAFPDAPHAFHVKDASLPSGTVMVLPLRPQTHSMVLSTTQPRALIVIRPAGGGSATPKELLRTLFGLTPAEAEAAHLIATGVSVAEASALLSVTQITIRNQLAAAMTKMGVHRQAELVAAVMRLAPRLKLDSSR